MKKLYLRSAVALACAVGLAACGGDDDGTYRLEGAVYGVNTAGLVLQNNGADDLVVEPNSSSFVFPKLVAQNGGFNISVKSVPANAQKCEVLNGKGTANAYNGTGGQIAVVCTLIPHTLSGTITGNSGGETVLVNGIDRITVPAGSGSFTFTRKDPADKTGVANLGTVGEGQAYGVLVLTPPPQRSCSVANGSGIMLKNDVTNIAVTCI